MESRHETLKNPRDVRKKSIFKRTLTLAWIIILVTIGIFLVLIIPYQRKSLIRHIESTGRVIGASIDRVTVLSILKEDYSTVIDHCLDIVGEEVSIDYIVATKRDGFSLIHTAGKWRTASLDGIWRPAEKEEGKGLFLYNDWADDRVFHYIHRLEYSGIHWGWIHVGLSLDSYIKELRNIYILTIFWAFIAITIGFALSYVFANRFSRPFSVLKDVTQRIADGDLGARADVRTGDELEAFARSFNRMALALQSSYDELESRVRERTADLAETNRILNEEIEERKRAEDERERLLRLEREQRLHAESLREVTLAITSKMNRSAILDEVLYQVQRIVPYSSASILLIDGRLLRVANSRGRSCYGDRELKIGDLFDRSEIPEYDKIIRTQKPYVLKDTDKVPGWKGLGGQDWIKSHITMPISFRNHVMGLLQLNSHNSRRFSKTDARRLVYLKNAAAIAIDNARLYEEARQEIKERKRTEEKIRRSLIEKEVLLKEIHHRVKNNLQVISSLLYLQSRRVVDEESLALFQDSQNRVKSMALIHEKLYRSKDFTNIDFNEYIRSLTGHLLQTYGLRDEKVDLQIQADDVSLTIDSAIPCGLIINELVSNAMKYAFRDDAGMQDENGKKIWVHLKKTAKNEKGNRQPKYTLVVGDNGMGFPEQIDWRQTESLGLRLVNGLTRQLNGTIELDPEHGTCFRVLFDG